MNRILVCENVSKTIRKKQILKNISFSLSCGEILGVLGADGSGKTTLLKILCGLHHPDNGSVAIQEHSIDRDYSQAMQDVRCVFSHDFFYRSMSGRDNLAVLRSGVSAEAIEHAAQMVGIQDLLDTRVSLYTPWQKRLLSLAHALCTEPKLLLLDDFLEGLNSWQAKNFSSLLRKIAAATNLSMIVTFTSYTGAGLLCDRVAFLSDGTLKHIKTVEELRVESGKIPYRFELRDVSRATRLLSDCYSFVIVGKGEDYLDLSITKDEIPVYNKLFVDNDIEVFGIELRELSVEQALDDMEMGGRS